MNTIRHRPPAGYGRESDDRADLPAGRESAAVARLWNAFRRAVEADRVAAALARGAAADPVDTLRYAVLADLLDERPLALTHAFRRLAPWWPDARGVLAARLAAALRWCHAEGKSPALMPDVWPLAWHWHLTPASDRGWPDPPTPPAHTLARRDLAPAAVPYRSERRPVDMIANRAWLHALA